MPTIDLDLSDTVTFTEFLWATIDISKLKDNENVLKHVYQLLDADNSGVLQADDL